MPIKEVKTRVVKLENGLAIPLPDKFCHGTELEEGLKIKIVYTKQGNFEVRLSKQDTMNLKCQICDKRQGKHSCSNCGLLACSNCFWEEGDICYNCANI